MHRGAPAASPLLPTVPRHPRGGAGVGEGTAGWEGGGAYPYGEPGGAAAAAAGGAGDAAPFPRGRMVVGMGGREGIPDLIINMVWIKKDG